MDTGMAALMKAFKEKQAAKKEAEAALEADRQTMVIRHTPTYACIHKYTHRHKTGAHTRTYTRLTQVHINQHKCTRTHAHIQTH